MLKKIVILACISFIFIGCQVTMPTPTKTYDIKPTRDCR
jgi:hypothetical protein